MTDKTLVEAVRRLVEDIFDQLEDAELGAGADSNPVLSPETEKDLLEGIEADLTRYFGPAQSKG